MRTMNAEIVALLIGGASLVLQTISMIPRGSGKLSEDDEAALRAVLEAYYATRAYYVLLERGEDNHGKEWDMALKWELAAKKTSFLRL